MNISAVLNKLIDISGIYDNQKALYFLSSAYVTLSGKGRRSRIKIAAEKDKYLGKRCFIIGNGPSLTSDDLDALKDEVTFASNRIFKMFDKTDWRPTYYAILDESIACDDDVPPNVNALDCELKFIRKQGWFVCRAIKNPCFLHTWYGGQYVGNPEFSADLTKGIYTIATVTYSLIQIARYMGFSEIYLIGVDHKYANERKQDGSIVKNEGIKSYFGKQENLEKKVVAATWEMEKAYQYAEDYSRKNGFRIYNATRGGYLEVFERVDFDEIINLNEVKL